MKHVDAAGASEVAAGLVDAEGAFAGFSNSAVITVWAMFILSEGLTRTGIADIIGRQVMRLAGRREIAMIVVIMITGAVLSAFMNNVGALALLMPLADFNLFMTYKTGLLLELVWVNRKTPLCRMPQQITYG